MPQVQPRSRVKRSGHKTLSDIRRDLPQAIPRDDLDSAFAGDDNRGPAGKISAHGRKTHVKSRRLRKGSGKIPKRK